MVTQKAKQLQVTNYFYSPTIKLKLYALLYIKNSKEIKGRNERQA
jgi:hypothetical protein